MTHTMDKHISNIQDLCRTCGEKLLTKKQKLRNRKPTLCINHVNDIFFVFGVNVNNDVPTKYSTSICMKCLFKIQHIQLTHSEQSLKIAQQIADKCRSVWCDYNPDICMNDCSVCFHYLIKCHGNMKYVMSTVPTNSEFIADKSDLSMNPEQPSIFLEDEVEVPDEKHLKTSSTSNTSTSTVQNINKPHVFLSQSLTKPLSSFEEKQLTHFVRRKLNTTRTHNIITCKTAGQPIILQKIINHRKESHEIKSPLKRQRSKLIQAVRERIAGTSTDSLEIQQSHELKRLSKKSRDNIAKTADLKVSIPTDLAFSMKESLGLSWRKERKHKSYLRQAGIGMPLERSERQCANDVTRDWVHVEVKEFEGEDGHTLEAPFAYINNLDLFVCALLSDYCREGLLTWHNNCIPEHQIWVKVGGDHGKGSFKITMQIANLEMPNSKSNTILIAIVRNKDTYNNVEIVMKHMKVRIEKLTQLEWEGKKLVVFFYGDYDFLTKVYGLSGAQGKYPCLWCLQTRSDMHVCVDSLSVQARSLSLMKEHHGQFIERYSGDKKHASIFYNCLHAPILNIEINKVAPPYLHILLGIVIKHHRLLEQAADRIDTNILESIQTEQICSSNTNTLKHFGKNWQQADILNLKIHKLHTQTLMCDNEEEKTNVKIKIKKAEDSLSKLRFAELCARSGPVCLHLDKVLDKHKITPQTYHSRAFVGNHCHKYLTCKVYKDLTDAIISHTQMYTQNQDIINIALNTKNIFNSLNEAFEKVHTLISHSKPIHVNTVPEIELAIHDYMTLYRLHFPNKIIPKQHILEHHCAHWIRLNGFGLGFFGEQGGEAAHSMVANIEKRAWGIRNQKEQLKFIINTHLLQVYPTVNANGPCSKKIKIK